MTMAMMIMIPTIMFMVLQSWKSQNLVSFNDNDDCEDDINEYNDEKDDIVD